MPPYRPDDEEDDDDEEWGEDYGEDEDEDDTVPCPYCRRMIHEDSQRCPHCEHYISEEDSPARKPPWIILGAILCLACLFAAYFLGFR